MEKSEGTTEGEVSDQSTQVFALRAREFFCSLGRALYPVPVDFLACLCFQLNTHQKLVNLSTRLTKVHTHDYRILNKNSAIP